MRILIVQWGGDYRQAYRRLRSSGTETYFGHTYILGELERMQRTFGDVAMLCCQTPERYVERVESGLTFMGAKAHPRRETKAIAAMIDEWNPTHVVVLGPLTGLLRSSIAAGRRVLCQMADSFNIPVWLRLWRYGRLAALLNDRRIEWISNHGVNACRSVAALGVDPAKILPWDFPYARRPDQLPPRDGPPAGVPRLLYVGTIQPLKGVGDLIAAVAELKRRGLHVALDLAGAGQVDRFRKQVAAAGLEDRVTFLGTLPNGEVFDRMRQAAAVVVPSRHNYPEGLPLTIYEALCARTPLIASDHPMFAGHLAHGTSALVFPARDAGALADRVAALVNDPALTATLSANAQATWERMQNPCKWGDVLFHWLSDTAADRAWLAARTLQPPAEEVAAASRGREAIA